MPRKSFGLPILSLVAIYGSMTAQAAGLIEWRQRSIYQVLTDRFARPSNVLDHTVPECNVEHGLFCGGSWSAIRENLDYIQGMNFDAIWISPVVKQMQQRTAVGDAYAGYWSQDLYQLEPHFGTEEDLKALVAELHSRKMLIMVDVVVNHMACSGECDYNTFNPFDNAVYYHDFCPMTDAVDPFTLQHCWLGDENVGLADLRTEDPWVRETFAEWISQLVSNYSIDGLRIDSAINVEPDFFPGFVDAAGVFATGEVMTGDERLACQWDESIGSILNYPIYYPLIRAFSSQQGDIASLVAKMNSVKESCVNTTSFATFSESHDVARFASLTSDRSLAENIIAFTIMADGIPVIFQGQEQRQNGSSKWTDNRAPLWEAGFDTSASLYKLIAVLNRSRKHISTKSQDFFEHSSDVIFQDDHSFALRKGVPSSQVITILTNHGQDSGQTGVELTNHGFPPGSRVVELLTCTHLVVDDRGLLKVTLFAGKPGIIHSAAWLAGSGLCSGAEKRTGPGYRFGEKHCRTSAFVWGAPILVNLCKSTRGGALLLPIWSIEASKSLFVDKGGVFYCFVAMKPSQRARQPSAAALLAAAEASLPTPPTTKRRKTAKRPRQSIDSQRAEAEAEAEAGSEAGEEAGERTGGYEDFEPTQDGGTAGGRPDQDEDEEEDEVST